MKLVDKILSILTGIWQTIREIVFGIGHAFASLGRKIAVTTKNFALKFVAFWVAFALFFKKLPFRVAHFFKTAPGAIVRFFKTFPSRFVAWCKGMTKDKAKNLIVGTCAIVVWCLPVAVVIYIFAWVLTTNL